ncbi:GTP cyclohydrolase II [Oceanomicrobium pacificus]|uniref:GTP cyclohydrolase-2 n=1 Tax=Oceanomicrobium pacificus TaxID=2692916 RepID=A0A6B0TLQ2_9RHOB|nr:GTP cyclohydrolase II [Oceanomicrobium pacificus]MXU64826.1 GTP cyclohydrolase II [Oceanomicrobium pacificus]
MGAPVVLTDGESAALALAVETLDAVRLGDLRDGGWPLHAAVTARRAETLHARVYDGDLARIALPADAGLDWLKATANPADDLRYPMKGPYASLRGGSPALDAALLLLCKQAHLLPAILIATLPADAARTLARDAGLSCESLDVIGPILHRSSPLLAVSAARVPLDVSEASRVHVFRPRDGGEEHYAIEIGQPNRSEPVLSRLHSACFTGDLAGSLKCDCGPQLRAALAQIGTEGAGVLLYLNQEGRGIGLANKMRAYQLQDEGFDTVEANHRLGFEDDERDFKIGAEILRSMGFSSVRLMTNNPAKVRMMETCGVAVAERVPLRVGETRHNRAYLDTKARKSGHLL